MNLFQTLLRPDREEIELGERVLIAKAANILQIGEFQLLQLAYRRWHGKDLPETMVSKLFSSYMIKNEVPHWARHYARHILDTDARGTLNENHASFHIYDHEYHTSVPYGLRRFWAAVSVLTVIVGGSIALADLSIIDRAGMFPPYLDLEDLKVSVSQASFGRADFIPASISGSSSLPDMGTGMLPAPP